jgi:hypothetical protein
MWLAGAGAVVTVGGRRERWDDEGRGAHDACQMSDGIVEGIPVPQLEGPYRGRSAVGHMAAARGAVPAGAWAPLEALGDQDRKGAVNCQKTDDYRHEQFRVLGPHRAVP